MSATKIDNGLWKIQAILTKRYGFKTAEREIAPLIWYINTGRASVDFLEKLFSSKPFMIANRLHKGGSDREVIERIKKLIGYVDAI